MGTRIARRARRWAPLVGFVVGVGAPAEGGAQYFGRNKVQYETFDFRVMHTRRFDIYYYPVESLATYDAARMAERWYARLGAALQHSFERKPLIFYANHPDFQQTNVVGGFLGQGTGGVTEGLKNRVVMPFTGVYEETDHVLGHELVHVFQYDMAAAPGGGGLRGMGALPLWLVEGMAEYLSVGRTDPHTAMWLRDAAMRNDLPTIRQLSTDPRYFPYRFGQGLWAYIGGRWGDDVIRDLYRAALRLGWEGGVRRVLRMSTDTLSAHWHRAIREAYLPALEGRTPPMAVGSPLLRERQERGEMNVAPVVSPDGRYAAFFSGRGLLTVDLFVADLQTGRIVERFGGPNVDRHFDALSFISSAGSWSPDGTRLAFFVFAQGDNELVIYDRRERDITRRVKVRGVGAMADPAWSPDGRQLAFSGIVGGISDLYLLDLETSAVRPLTEGRHAEFQPAWSPDGRTLAFVTDRGPATDFGVLSYGRMRLATLGVAGGAVTLLPALGDAKHINPQWSPDGRELYFISDYEGVSDLFRLTLAAGEAVRLTRTATGVSGITDLSPAMSVAAQDGRVVFSVFVAGGYQIRSLTPAEARGEPVTPAPAPAGAVALTGVLPPAQALGRRVVSQYLSDPRAGLPESPEYRVTAYRPSLNLDYLGAPAVGVAVNPYGAGVAGGIAGYFSDMLGNRVVGAELQAQGDIKDVGGQVFFQNLRRRWNWGLGAGHFPFIAGVDTEIKDTAVTLEGGGQDTVRLVQQFVQRVFLDQASAMIAYPFTTTRRLEFTAGYQHIGFDVDVDEVFVDDFGRAIGQRRLDAPTPAGLNYVSGAAAFVGDYSFFGLTSPIAGGRYRFEASPVFGSLTFQTLLADYRRYLYFRRLTLAVRGLHYGRYGEDAEDDRLTPLFLGYETFVRGYAVESFDAAECTEVANEEDSCPEFDRLLGSRIALANLELRVPLLGPEEIAVIPFQYLPVELTPFVDAGVAWTRDDTPQFRFARAASDRVPVVSAGISTRVNVLGYIIVEAYYAYPFQREVKGAHFGFQIAPGW